MLSISANDRHRYCDGLNRRSFLKAGFLGLAGLSLPQWLSLKAQAEQAGKSTKDTSVILIWLDGGPTHMDTYDLKPNAPAEFRGAMKAAKTNVPGIEICDLMPRQAKIMDKLTIVRSLFHSTGDHFEGAHWMLTGYRGSNAARLDPMFPSAGSYAAKLRGANASGVPAYVAVPVASSVGLVPGYNSGAYLGTAFNPFQTGGDPNSPNFSVQNLTLPGGLTVAELDDRRKLLNTFDTLRRDIDRSGTLDNLDKFQREAYELISGPSARRAFDLSREDPRIKDLYGRHTWGQSTLLARRLVEAGVTFVTVHMGGWDHHSAIEAAMKSNLPPLDKAIAGLVTDLNERGLYEKTAIYVCGEFGRTPMVNKDAGRDHWGQSGFGLLGGGGIKGGIAYGSTDAKVAAPKNNPVGPDDVLATLYHVLGIDTTLKFEDKTGRPHPILNSGAPIADLV